ncbi:hypothetical protein [Latilactobacillus curvatus]|uniref:hypothetical protein n=1 Tax=Latilactobacillus curvatus TaxID=28038 RepID=UPI001F51C589|nr:hypothetical protein [Latilactobacillus curvatus]
MAKQKTNWRWVDWLYVFTIVSQLIYIGYYLEQMLTNPKEKTTEHCLLPFYKWLQAW